MAFVDVLNLRTAARRRAISNDGSQQHYIKVAGGWGEEDVLRRRSGRGAGHHAGLTSHQRRSPALRKQRYGCGAQ